MGISMDDNNITNKNSNKTDKVNSFLLMIKKRKWIFIVIILILAIATNWFIIEIVTQKKAEQITENIIELNKFNKYGNEIYRTSQYYYLTFFNPRRENFVENIKEGQTYDNEFYKYLSLYKYKIDEMNRVGVDNINRATCADHKMLASNKEIYGNSGIAIKEENCIYSFTENWNYLYDVYSRSISEEYGLWLKYLGKKYNNSKKHIYKAEELRDNILYLEGLLEKNPKFVAQREVDAELSHLLYQYMQHDNTNVYKSNNILNPEYKKSYETFLRKNPESIYYMLVKDYYQILKENNFKYTPAVKEWLDASIEKVYIDIDPGEGLDVK